MCAGQGGRREEEQPPESPSTAASPADNAAAAPEPATAAEQPNETGAKEVQETESDSDAESENELDLLTAMKRLGLSVPDETTPLPPPRPPVLTSFDLAGVAVRLLQLPSRYHKHQRVSRPRQTCAGLGASEGDAHSARVTARVLDQRWGPSKGCGCSRESSGPQRALL
jgi:hypothetical protein